MYELHKNEQYFFNQATLHDLGGFLARWSSPCCLCAPLLGKYLRDRGVNVTILDIDDRFESMSGFRKYNIYKPEHLKEEFDLILCDPPFFKVSLSQLFAAIRNLSHGDFSQKIMVSYLKRRESAVLGTFARFGIEPTGYSPTYQTVQKCERNLVEFYSNFGVRKEQIEIRGNG